MLREDQAMRVFWQSMPSYANLHFDHYNRYVGHNPPPFLLSSVASQTSESKIPSQKHFLEQYRSYCFSGPKKKNIYICENDNASPSFISSLYGKFYISSEERYLPTNGVFWTGYYRIRDSMVDEQLKKGGNLWEFWLQNGVRSRSD